MQPEPAIIASGRPCMVRFSISPSTSGAGLLGTVPALIGPGRFQKFSRSAAVTAKFGSTDGKPDAEMVAIACAIKP